MSVVEIHLTDAILDAYEVGREAGSREALRSLDDMQTLLGNGSCGCGCSCKQGHPDDPTNDPAAELSYYLDEWAGINAANPDVATELDPDVVYLDNLGDRVLALEQALKNQRTCACGILA